MCVVRFVDFIGFVILDRFQGEYEVPDASCMKNNGCFLDFPVYLWKPVAGGSFFFLGQEIGSRGSQIRASLGGRCTKISKKSALKRVEKQ